MYAQSRQRLVFIRKTLREGAEGYVRRLLETNALGLIHIALTFAAGSRRTDQEHHVFGMGFVLGGHLYTAAHVALFPRMLQDASPRRGTHAIEVLDADIRFQPYGKGFIPRGKPASAIPIPQDLFQRIGQADVARAPMPWEGLPHTFLAARETVAEGKIHELLIVGVPRGKLMPIRVGAGYLHVQAWKRVPCEFPWRLIGGRFWVSEDSLFYFVQDRRVAVAGSSGGPVSFRSSDGSWSILGIMSGGGIPAAQRFGMEIGAASYLDPRVGE